MQALEPTWAPDFLLMWPYLPPWRNESSCMHPCYVSRWVVVRGPVHWGWALTKRACARAGSEDHLLLPETARHVFAFSASAPSSTNQPPRRPTVGQRHQYFVWPCFLSALFIFSSVPAAFVLGVLVNCAGIIIFHPPSVSLCAIKPSNYFFKNLFLTFLLPLRCLLTSPRPLLSPLMYT